MNYDLVVVGASFSGLACAQAAALAGLRVAVVDKKSHSGAKIHTTGVVVKDALDACTWLQSAPEALFRKIEGVRLYAPNLLSMDLYAPGYFFMATDTSGLLDWMVEDVRRLGVDVLFDCVFEQAQASSQGTSFYWRVVCRQTRKLTIEASVLNASYLVGADGPHSKVAKVLGLSENTEFLFGHEQEWRGVDMDAKVLHCFVSHQFAPGYLGWALQGVGIAQIGLAQRYRARDARSHKLNLDGFINYIRPHVDVASAQNVGSRAGMIPCGGVLKRIARPRAVLVGDAAGLVSPVTAGGIHTALKYGAHVGQAVARFVVSKSPSVQDPALNMQRDYPSFLLKSVLRTGYDYAQSDWLMTQLFRNRWFKRVAEQMYFHRKGQ